MSTVQAMQKKVKHLKHSFMLQGSNQDMPTEASWTHVKELPTMGSTMEQLRVNLEHADEALETYRYVRVISQNIYMRKP